MRTQCDCVCHRLGYVYCGPGWCERGHEAPPAAVAGGAVGANGSGGEPVEGAEKSGAQKGAEQ